MIRTNILKYKIWAVVLITVVLSFTSYVPNIMRQLHNQEALRYKESSENKWIVSSSLVTPIITHIMWPFRKESQIRYNYNASHAELNNFSWHKPYYQKYATEKVSLFSFKPIIFGATVKYATKIRHGTHQKLISNTNYNAKQKMKEIYAAVECYKCFNPP